MSIDTQVLEVVQKYLHKVRRSGPEDILAICPFHIKADGTQERTPSFSMSITKGLWFCHSCHERGTFRSFLKNIGVSRIQIDRFYKPLLEQLDELYRQGKTKRKCSFIQLQNEAMEESILGLFDELPLTLLEDGFSEQTLRHFDVGYDKKNNKITYPLRDLWGRLVGFSGRAMGKTEWPRYKIYSEEEYENWGLPPRRTERNEILWNADKVYPATYFSSNPDTIIPVVEGYKACMWLFQAGYREVVCLQGSYMSDIHQMILERMGGRIFLFFDNDSPGHKCYWESGQRLWKSLPTYVVQYEGHQPTDLSPDEIRKAIEMAPEFYQWAYAGR